MCLVVIYIFIQGFSVDKSLRAVIYEANPWYEPLQTSKEAPFTMVASL